MSANDFVGYSIGIAILILALLALLFVATEIWFLRAIYKWLKNLKP